MLVTIVRKTVQFYTLPARLAYRQGHRSLERVRALHRQLEQRRLHDRALSDQWLEMASRQMGIDPATLTREQRLHKMRSALANVEYGLGLAASEGIRALVLAALKDHQPRPKQTPPAVIEGEFERRSGG